MRRTLHSGFIVAYLALQLGLPLRYYLGDDRFDERFAWRMFSPIRVQDCSAAFTEQLGAVRAAVDPYRELAPAWVGLIERARLSVIEGYAQLHCEKLRQRVARPHFSVDLRCVQPDGTTLAPVPANRNLCSESP